MASNHMLLSRGKTKQNRKTKSRLRAAYYLLYEQEVEETGKGALEAADC